MWTALNILNGGEGRGAYFMPPVRSVPNRWSGTLQFKRNLFIWKHVGWHQHPPWAKLQTVFQRLNYKLLKNETLLFFEEKGIAKTIRNVSELTRLLFNLRVASKWLKKYFKQGLQPIVYQTIQTIQDGVQGYSNPWRVCLSSTCFIKLWIFKIDIPRFSSDLLQPVRGLLSSTYRSWRFFHWMIFCVALYSS